MERKLVDDKEEFEKKIIESTANIENIRSKVKELEVELEILLDVELEVELLVTVVLVEEDVELLVEVELEVDVDVELVDVELLVEVEEDVFDVVFHMGGINFFNDKAQAIREMVRVAKAGTKLVIVDENEMYTRRRYYKTPLIMAPVSLLPSGMEDVRYQ
ncbi:hypothetical protein LCGC14_2710340, partial [marine sediment metagenome]